MVCTSRLPEFFIAMDVMSKWGLFPYPNHWEQEVFKSAPPHFY